MLDCQHGGDSVSLQLRGTAHELVPRDLQSELLAKVWTTNTKEKYAARRQPLYFGFGEEEKNYFIL